MKKKIFNILQSLLIVIGIISFCYLFKLKTIDNDLFFDIKTGEYILKHGIDFKDHFSFIPNLTYLYHHWLYDVFIYIIFKKFKYWGIYNFTLLLLIIISLIYYKSCKKITNSRTISFLITIVIITFIAKYFQTRVQSITYVLYLLDLIYLEKICNGKKIYILPLVFNSILTLNIHMPLWFLTIILVIPYLIENIISLIFNKISNKKIKKYINKFICIDYTFNKYIIYTFIILLFTGFISIYGLKTFDFILTLFKTSSYQKIGITELKPLVLINNYLAVLIIIIFITGLYLRVLKITLRDFILFSGLFIFALLAQRNIVYFMIIGPLIILKGYYNKDNLLRFNYLNKLNKYPFIIMIDIIIILSFCTMTNNILNSTNNYEEILKSNTPVDAVKYIKKKLDYKNIRMYNDFNYGAYLLYKDIPVFIDSRAEVYIKEFNGGYDIVNDFKKIDSLKYKSIFKKYNIEYALVYRNSRISDMLKIDNEYKILYKDRNYILYKKDIKCSIENVNATLKG